MPDQSLQFSDFCSAVAYFQGYGRNPFNWSGQVLNAQQQPSYTTTDPDSQLGDVLAAVAGGYRMFCSPPLVDAGPVAYEWSFLTPERTLSVIAGVGVYQMPDDFRDLLGEFNYQPTDSTYLTIREVGIGAVQRTLQQLFSETGKAEVCAIYPLASDGTMPQRWAVSFAPLFDAPYTLTYRSSLNPLPLSPLNRYPLGGPAHAETVQQACLAWAERHLQGEIEGPEQTAFVERLKASIALDRELRPAGYGYCGDRSDDRDLAVGYQGYSPWQTQTTGVTYNGASPW